MTEQEVESRARQWLWSKSAGVYCEYSLDAMKWFVRRGIKLSKTWPGRSVLWDKRPTNACLISVPKSVPTKTPDWVAIQVKGWEDTKK